MKWCRWLTAPSTRWSNAVNFRAASHCPHAVSSGTWLKSKPGSCPVAPHQSLAFSIQTSGNGARGRSKSRVERDDRHLRRNEHWDVLASLNPGINHVRPLLQHVPALNLVFSLIVNAT